MTNSRVSFSTSLFAEPKSKQKGSLQTEKARWSQTELVLGLLRNSRLASKPLRQSSSLQEQALSVLSVFLRRFLRVWVNEAEYLSV
jgi:hypothetical protein